MRSVLCVCVCVYFSAKVIQEVKTGSDPNDMNKRVVSKAGGFLRA